MSLRIKEFHDCPSIRPSMIVGQESREVVSGTWPFRRREKVLNNIYSVAEAEWICPRCGSLWEYYALSSKHPLWRAERREYTWKTVDEE